MASASVTAITDPIQLFHLLETADVEVDHIRALIHENLNQTREPSYLNSLIDFCLNTGYPRCTDLLAGVREPHDKHLFDKLNDCLKSSNTRQQSLSLLSHVVYKYPSWLYKISQHSLLPSLFKLLKVSSDVLHLVGAVLIVVTLLPVIPSSVAPFLNDIFDIFTRLAAMHSKKSASIPEVYLMHLHVAIYALFHRLYSMYPCHFIGYMRTYCSGSSRENLQIFSDTIRPMLDYVRLHPLLVTASKEIEISKTRWKRMETHDIVVECAKLSLDVVESTREDSPGPRLSYSCFRPVQEVCELLYPSYGFICPTSQVPAESNEHDKSIVGMTSRMDPTSVNWSPSISCGLSTPPRTHQISPSPSYAEICGKQQSVPPSPLRMDTSSPFKFPPICEHPFQNSSMPCGTCSEGASKEPMKTLTQVAKKLEEQKSSEELVDTEVASIIGQGPSPGRSHQQQPRVVRVPSQWASVSPYLKSLQGTQRSRSFSQGKKGSSRRSAAIEVPADRRVIPMTLMTSLTRTRSLPELRTLAAESFDSEVASTTKMPFTGPSPSVDCEMKNVSGGGGAAATLDDQLPCSNYAHLLPSAFPHLPATKPTPGCSSNQSPLFTQLSPSEVLDRYIEGCRDVYAKKASILTNPKESALKDEIEILRGQVQLLHVQLMYERQKREIHAERNRRLLGKTKRTKALEEENMAMKDQMQLQEKEIAQLSWEARKYRSERLLAAEKKDQELEAVRDDLKTIKREKTALMESCRQLEDKLADSQLKVTELTSDVANLGIELFNTHHDLEAIKSQVSLNESLRYEVERLNKELLLTGEMNQKCQEKIEMLKEGALYEVKLSSLRHSYAAEVKGLKAALESKDVITECAKATVAELEGIIGKKDKVIAEQKRLLQTVKLEYDEQVKAVEDKYEGRRFICQHLESEILKLHCKLETIASDKVRRRGSQSRQTTTSQQPPGAASVASDRTGPSRMRAPESSIAITTATAAVTPMSNAAEFGGGGSGGARRKTSVPINIERPSSRSKETSGGGGVPFSKRQQLIPEEQRHDKAGVAAAARDQRRATTVEQIPEIEERLSGALEVIAARSLASIVDFGESALEHPGLAGDAV